MRIIKLLFAIFLGLNLLSCDSERTMKNQENIKKISKGMELKDVVSIMGTPEVIQIIPPNDSVFVLIYTAPTGLSDNYRIQVSRKDSITVYVGTGL